ncbi:hypothetical protein CPAR01_13620 [Colletotrichum paranaense]|uniref:Uncharacterized protein n=1 Tax=Colletotrichum paranaense TaxID=1914294 RepID=A0ABQ9S4K0_9PEZI|nr:uncharacterized protein CPAR01_13620 [Colletotrichum paranaense]KAK1524672.1 hypothetical protein CPAR01_13620 [Colletotrichum paranaense]
MAGAPVPSRARLWPNPHLTSPHLISLHLDLTSGRRAAAQGRALRETACMMCGFLGVPMLVVKRSCTFFIIV